MNIDDHACHYCKRRGIFATLCRSTRDMEDRSHDATCRTQLMNLGGGEYVENQKAAGAARPCDGGT
jgi:hypothetical protein